MTTTAQGTFDVQSWDENVLHEVDGKKISLAKVTQKLTGDIEGECTTEFLMCYSSDTYASFAGLSQVKGSLAGRQGSFTLQASGEYKDGKAGGTWFVVPGSGAGELASLKGEGGYPPQDGMSLSWTLDYSFE